MEKINQKIERKKAQIQKTENTLKKQKQQLKEYEQQKKDKEMKKLFSTLQEKNMDIDEAMKIIKNENSHKQSNQDQNGYHQ